MISSLRLDATNHEAFEKAFTRLEKDLRISLR
jgi:hypothetical protein